VTISDIDAQLEGEARCEITCRIAGQPARFNPRSMDDWTDLETVLGGLNAGLAAAGRSQRFANLSSGSQDAHVIIAQAAGLASLVETLGLPLDAIAAITAGVAAETHAVAQMKAELSGFKTMGD
jgi:hypothetical protein